MLRKFLLFLLRVTDKKRDNPEKMTDAGATPSSLKLRTITSHVHITVDKNVTSKQLRAMMDVWHSSPVIHHISEIESMLQGKYKLNPLEVHLIDQMIERYNTLYKSPLANAMDENYES
jgi:hypothetical protein